MRYESNLNRLWSAIMILLYPDKSSANV